jgi:hypothetical protein
MSPCGRVTHYTTSNSDGPASSVVRTVLHRDPPYQVELFCVCAADQATFIPIHRHPNVDTFESYVSGDIEFNINGKILKSCNIQKGDMPQLFRVRSKDWHGAKIGPNGAVFLSLQRWATEPTSVGDDWIGPPHA